jgi:hypothetical protein
MVRKFAGLSAIRHRKTESMTSFIRQSILSGLQLELDYSHGASGSGERYFYSFDQCSFADKGVPSIMLTSGMYADYNKHTDDTELIDFDGLLKRTKLAFLFLWEIVNVDFNIILMSTMQEKLVL